MKKILFGLLSSLVLFGCQSKEVRLKVAASPTPHAEILEQIKPEMKERGINLQIVEVEDYNLPNRLLSEGVVDANYFQHTPFLDMQIQEFGYEFKPLGKVHIAPLGVYSQRIETLDSLKSGGVVAIPSDPTNEGRALQLLAKQGLIELKPDVKLPTPLDISQNERKLKFLEIDASLLPRTLSDVDIAVIPSNFALQAKLDPTQDSLVRESPDSPYVNVLVIRSADQDRPELQLLSELLTSDKIRTYIQQKFKGAIVPAF